MSPHSPATLHRIGAAAGGGTAAILLVNAAKRADVIPTTALTQLIAPLAQILALALITVLYLAYGRRAGTFGLVGYLLNAFSLAALVGVEFVINLVFAELPVDTVDALRAGPLGVALTVSSVAFLLGTVAFVAAMVRTGEVPTTPLVLYAVGAVPVSLRAVVPEAVLNSGLVVMAIGVGWTALWLLARSSRRAPATRAPAGPRRARATRAIGGSASAQNGPLASAGPARSPRTGGSR
jgi:hypothetical protein